MSSGRPGVGVPRGVWRGACTCVCAWSRLRRWRSPVDCVMIAGSKPTLSDLSCSPRPSTPAATTTTPPPPSSWQGDEPRRWSLSGRSPVLEARSAGCELRRSTFRWRSSLPEELMRCSLLGSLADTDPPPPPTPPPRPPRSSTASRQSTEKTRSRCGVIAGDGSEDFSSYSLTLYEGVGTSKVLWNCE